MDVCDWALEQGAVGYRIKSFGFSINHFHCLSRPNDKGDVPQVPPQIPDKIHLSYQSSMIHKAMTSLTASSSKTEWASAPLIQEFSTIMWSIYICVCVCVRILSIVFRGPIFSTDSNFMLVHF